MSATWRPTCGHTRVRNRTSVSFAPSAAVIAVTCHTIADDATNSCQWRVLAHFPIRRCWVFYRRRPARWAMAADYSSTSIHRLWLCTRLITWTTSPTSCPIYARKTMTIRIDQSMKATPLTKITTNKIWLWITLWINCPLWQASWPAYPRTPSPSPSLQCLQEKSLLLMRNPSSFSSPTQPQHLLPWQSAWLTPPPPPQLLQNLVLLHIAVAVLEVDPAVITADAQIHPVSPTASPAHRPTACLHPSRTPMSCTTASTVTFISQTTSCTPSTWVATATRTRSSATSVVTSARASTTLPATLPVGSTSDPRTEKSFNSILYLW